jgi:hypothetical protein
MLLTADLLRVLCAFARANTPVVALKGPALSQQLYRDAMRRESLDIDLLVARESMGEAAAILETEGFILQSRLAWLGLSRLAEMTNELSFAHASGTTVDLHWELAPADYPFQLSASAAWSSLTSIEIAGRRVSVFTPEFQVVYLAIHGTRHAWSHMRWLTDLAVLLSRPALDWSRIRTIAAENRVWRPVHLGLLLTHELLGAPVPTDVLNLARSDSAVSRAALEVGRRLTSEYSVSPMSSVRKTWFTTRLAPTARLKVRHLLARLKSPTEADAFVRLPPSLVGLYYPLRAARLAAKYGRVPFSR